MSKVVLYSLLVLFAGVVIVTAQNAGDNCVVEEPLREGLYVALPDCGQYLQCDNGVYVARLCPAGLHWSTFHVACNWPQFANCASAARVDMPIQGVN